MFQHTAEREKRHPPSETFLVEPLLACHTGKSLLQAFYGSCAHAVMCSVAAWTLPLSCACRFSWRVIRFASAALMYPSLRASLMAAVAGAVAEEMLQAMTGATDLTRAYVNDGGDIALCLAEGENFVVGMVERPERPSLFGTVTLDSSQPIRGIATSGWRGRSFSLGIADAVTVLAEKAAMADAAATIIANAVDLPGHPAIGRARACDLAPDSALGERLVTQSIGELSACEINQALSSGVKMAESLRRAGLIHAAALSLQREVRVCGIEAGLELAGTAGPDRSLVHA